MAIKNIPSAANVGVKLQRAAVPPTRDLGLWAAIRSQSKALAFGHAGNQDGSAPARGYAGFVEAVLWGGDVSGIVRNPAEGCGPLPDLGALAKRAKDVPLHGTAGYELLKTATEIFLLWNSGVAVRRTDALGNMIATDDEELARSALTVDEITAKLASYLTSDRLPYIERVLHTALRRSDVSDSAFGTGAPSRRADCVCLVELIWSYWHEEGALVRTLNAVSHRFQNVRAPGDHDPLAHLEIDPIRPLNNLLWSYVQDERNRLTLERRALEYDHQYGLTVSGVPAPLAADSRSRFLGAFHNLLHLGFDFYRQDADTTVIADGFPLLFALKEVHLLLAEGAHNQFGDVPRTARAEMMMQQWLLARPEMREFLRAPAMVPYAEAWMPPVDAMKTLQGWSDVNVTHFHELATYGEQILLSVRYGDWGVLEDENHAKNWARYWRAEIQGYLHAYRTVTGVDLTNGETVDATMPAVHLQKRLANVGAS
jgi:hypothetical protein